MFAIYAKIAGRVTREPINLEASLGEAKAAANAWLKKTTATIVEEHAAIPEADWKEEAYERNGSDEAEELAYAAAEVVRGPLKCTLVIQHVPPSV